MFVYHYAPWVTLRAIAESGELRPSNAGAPDERPLLWFSRHRKWEPTATKMLTSDAGPVRISRAEHEHRFGCIRFALPADDPRLMDWPSACQRAGISDDERATMEHRGRLLGANPSDWLAIDGAVPLAEVEFHAWLAGRWGRAEDLLGMADAWDKARG